MCKVGTSGDRCSRCSPDRTERRIAFAIDLAAAGRPRLGVIALLAALAAHTRHGRTIRLTPYAPATLANLIGLDDDTIGHVLDDLIADGTLAEHPRAPGRFTLTVAHVDQLVADTITPRINHDTLTRARRSRDIWRHRHAQRTTPPPALTLDHTPTTPVRPRRDARTHVEHDNEQRRAAR